MAGRRRPVGVRRRDRPSHAPLNPAFRELEARAGPDALKALEKAIVARAGLSEAALIAGGLHVLPDFIGARSPTPDPGARGGVIGLDLREDAASLEELYVAALCGLAYGLADIVGKLERSGYEFDSIVVSGGAARSALVRQIIADVCGKTVEAPETPEPVLLGSAMVGAVAAGRETMASAMASMSAIAPHAVGARGRGGRRVPRAKAPMPSRRCGGPSGRFARRCASLAGPKWSFSIATACSSTAKGSRSTSSAAGLARRAFA